MGRAATGRTPSPVRSRPHAVTWPPLRDRVTRTAQDGRGAARGGSGTRPRRLHPPARERLAERGTTFRNHYAPSAMCSSSRSVIYTGQHLRLTEVYDNDNMPCIRPLDPRLGAIGTMLRSAGYYLHLPGQVTPLQRLRHPRAPTSPPHRRPGAVRLQRVQRLERHRRRRLGRPRTRPRHRRTAGAPAARPGSGRGRRSAVAHGRQLREPARHHELRLRRLPTGPAPLRPRPRHGRPSRPATTEELLAENDVVLYDRARTRRTCATSPPIPPTASSSPATTRC